MKIFRDPYAWYTPKRHGKWMFALALMKSEWEQGRSTMYISAHWENPRKKSPFIIFDDVQEEAK